VFASGTSARARKYNQTFGSNNWYAPAELAQLGRRRVRASTCKIVNLGRAVRFPADGLPDANP